MKGHLTQEELKKWQNGEFTATERMQVLEHVGQCDLCAQLLAESFAAETLLTVPEGFAQRVQAATKKPYITVTPVSAAGKGLTPARKKDPQKELRAYSLRVGIAACAAILFLLAGGMRLDFSDLDDRQLNDLEFSRIHNVTEYMRSLTDGIFKWED